jgi:hypothetical protein
VYCSQLQSRTPNYLILEASCPYISPLKMEAVRSFETSAKFYYTTRGHSPEAGSILIYLILHRRCLLFSKSVNVCFTPPLILQRCPVSICTRCDMHTQSVRRRHHIVTTWVRSSLWWTEWQLGRFIWSTSVSPANSHSTQCSTLVYHPALVQ